MFWVGAEATLALSGGPRGVSGDGGPGVRPIKRTGWRNGAWGDAATPERPLPGRHLFAKREFGASFGWGRGPPWLPSRVLGGKWWIGDRIWVMSVTAVDVYTPEGYIPPPRPLPGRIKHACQRAHPPRKRAFWGRSVPPCSISPACTFDRAHTQPSIPRPTPWASAESQGRLCPDPKHFSNSPFLHVDPPGNRAWGGRTAPCGVKIHRDGQV